EYLRIPQYAVFRLPDAVDDEVGALAEPLAVVVHAARLGNVHLGDRVLILGGGTIGLLAVAAARAAGAQEVWITARHPQQQAAAERLGASRAFGPDDSGELTASAGEHPVDVVIETVGGTADTINEGIYLVRPGGCVVVLGVFSTAPQLAALAVLLKEVRLVG